MSRLRRILHATDFSPASRAGFARAMAMAKADRAQLVLVHVLTPQAALAVNGYMSPRIYDDLEAAAEKYGQRHLDVLEAKARKGGVRSKTLLLHGLADLQIIRAARSTKTDLIVIGTHGRTGLARLFLGSVRLARAGRRALPCPDRARTLTVFGKGGLVMKSVAFMATALVFTALAFGPAGAQSGSPGGPPQAANDEQMQQMMKRMQDMQEQTRGTQGQMQGMGSMRGDMRQMMAMMAQMQGMMQQHREQMGMGMPCPMMAAPQPPAKSEP